jgi:hypothetical protein
MACFYDLFGENSSCLPLFSSSKRTLKGFKNILSLASSFGSIKKEIINLEGV